MAMTIISVENALFIFQKLNGKPKIVMNVKTANLNLEPSCRLPDVPLIKLAYSSKG